MRIKNFKATFFAKQYLQLRSSDPELLFESAIDEVVPPLAILLLHVMEVSIRLHGYYM